MPNERYYRNMCLEGLTETTEDFSQVCRLLGRDFTRYLPGANHSTITSG
jgi:hypothetical protein